MDYIKPLSNHWNSEQFDYTLLLFPILHEEYPNGAIFGGLLIDNFTFIENFVARRFAAITNGEFLFAVERVHDNSLIYYSSEEAPVEPFEESADLWVLTDLQLKVKMVGTTLDRLSRERARKNIILLIVVNLLFIIGIIYIIRNLAKEIELARIKSNLVANVSHEIRTPIALIRMYSETLEMGRITREDKKQKYYKTMLAESIRLSQLVNNMLDFSKIESNRKEYRKSPHNLAHIVENILDMYQYNFEQAGFTVHKQLQNKIPEISIDSDAITQAFVNLLDNAMKYSQDHKVIHITLEQENHSVVLSVQDFGIGIPEQEHRKIFQKFYRVGDSLVHNTKGSGLGLSLVNHIMKVHGGHVIVKSHLGTGSTFSLVFPYE